MSSFKHQGTLDPERQHLVVRDERPHNHHRLERTCDASNYAFPLRLMRPDFIVHLLVLILPLLFLVPLYSLYILSNPSLPFPDCLTLRLVV